ncbi:MAG TPA: hypothetical protein VJR89_01165 [Polyangiales bacterium]|nr:hypothetical protein [Polyangiales bacterium]
MSQSDPEPQRYELRTADNQVLRLTRYVGGNKGPVLVVHGVGVWSGMFALPTVEQNFKQYLVANGYDVWLFDWRGSTQLPLTQFTFDQAAEYDYPPAVALIQRETGADSVQAVVHCAGSSTFFMSLARGLLPTVRSVACSQVALHYEVPTSTEAKAWLRLPDLLAASGRDYMTPNEDPSQPLFQTLFGQMVDTVHHECRSTVCHRITFLYGHLYSHARMNTETHDRLHEQFGKCNILAFRHLAQLALAGTAQRFDHGALENRRRYGTEQPPSYLDPRHLRIPITFVSGANNRTFVPRSTELTHDWLVSKNDPSLYRRHVLPDYGHIDTFMGATANRDAYPLFLEHLERTQP